jgi:hypothetical protein
MFDGLLLVASLAAVLVSQPKDPCAPLVAEAAQLLGVAAAKPEPMRSVGQTTLCRVPSADGNAIVVLTREQADPAQRLMMNSMIAERSESTKGAYRKETTLGAHAFSVQEPTSVLFNFAGGGVVLSVQLNKDAGVKPVDIDRLRAFAKRLQATK